MILCLFSVVSQPESRRGDKKELFNFKKYLNLRIGVTTIVYYGKP